MAIPIVDLQEEGARDGQDFSEVGAQLFGNIAPKSALFTGVPPTWLECVATIFCTLGGGGPPHKVSGHKNRNKRPGGKCAMRRNRFPARQQTVAAKSIGRQWYLIMTVVSKLK